MRPIVAVVTCHARRYPKHDQGGHPDGESRVQVVRDTWYKRWDGRVELKFFYGRGGNREPLPDEVFLDCGDDYYSLPEKVKKICQYSAENGFSHVLKLDDDVFTWPERLSLPEHEYVGYEIDSGVKYASGTAYWLGRRAMEFVADAEIPEGEWREDRHVGAVLARNGIQVVHDYRYLCCSCDVCLAKYDKDSLISIHTTHPSQMETYYGQCIA